MIISDEDYLMHYGILRKSGRYPWGSGKDQATRNRTFLDTIENLKAQGMSEADIAKGFSTKEHPFTTSDLRALKSIAINQQREDRIRQAQRMKDKGMSNVAIGERMGINESSVRSLLEPGAQDKVDVLRATSSMLRKAVDEKKFVDIGAHTNIALDITDTKLKTAVAVLKEEGYRVYTFKTPTGNGNETNIKVLTAPGTTFSEVYKNKGNIQQIKTFSEDGGRTYEGAIKPPLSISSKRVAVRYAEDGGAKADGIIYVRPGVDDISLGASRYAQVRIAVDNTHYMKGVAVYKEDLPKGVDLEFNTNKSSTGNKLDAMKPMKDDPDNPFSSLIKRQSGVMNIINEEGDWSNWSRNLSSQFLSKQSPALAKGQLDMTFDKRARDLAEINSLTNPAVKKKLLKSFAEDADSASVHLKAAGLPGTANHVILPIKSIKEGEIFAPNFKNGDRVALVRHPHGGPFEIPELTVNNRNPEARKSVGSQSLDAVGIHHKVAERLSGADFDGDTVLVIQNNNGRVKSAPALAGLKDFDPHSYKIPEGSKTKVLQGSRLQTEMGKVSNLITDMTLRGASAEEKARAVRHSMVVIDAEKHKLDYKASERDNGIAALKAKYQYDPANPRSSGASTLISRTSSKVRVPERTLRKAGEGGPIDKDTGKLVFVETGKTRERDGKSTPVTKEYKRGALTDDAHTLSSGTPMERVYADHSNRLKGLANQARKEMVNTKPRPMNASAKVVYANEVASLNTKLRIAQRNAPLERQAQLLANATVAAKRQANPDLDSSEVKKIKKQALDTARIRVGASKNLVDITPKEWDAIQAGAISSNKLDQILQNTDVDKVRKLATPKATTTVSNMDKARAKAMFALGYTQAEVAAAVGVPVSTLMSNVNE